MTDATHDPARTSWVASANGHSEFPIQNLPFGVFSTHGGRPRGGVAIGDAVFDIAAGLEAGLFSGATREAAEAAAGRTLNPLLALPAGARRALRQRLSDVLDARGAERTRLEPLGPRLLHNAADCVLHLPATVGDYTDFFAGIHHARKGGQISTENPLMPNYKYVPVAYHSRASSVRPSGEAVRRPNGQRKPPDQSAPDFGPCRNLDYELELGVWIGPGNPLGEPIPIDEAAQHIAGFCLLNDWSARDIQSWESQPLGPFLAKSFRTSVSPLDHHGRSTGAVPRTAARAPRWRSATAAASLWSRRPGARHARHRMRGNPVHVGNASRWRRTLSPMPLEHA